MGARDVKLLFDLLKTTFAETNHKPKTIDLNLWRFIAFRLLTEQQVL